VGIMSFNISGPGNPVLTGSFPTPGIANGFALRDGRVYLTDYYSLTILEYEHDAIDDNGPRPESHSLLANYPNPFNNETTIELNLANSSENVTLSIYDICGRTIAGLYDGSLSAGTHHITWDGIGADNRQLSSGIYFCKLKAGHSEETRKMVLLR